MESDPDDLDNIFDEYEAISRPEDENSHENDNALANEEKPAEKVPVPKRIVKNPRLKFNADRLCGERGIPVLVTHFKDVKFKGKNYEKEDLNKLLATLTHWCHRLYPSMKFEDCLRQIEKLGKKRPVQTCLRKIRLNMPILNNEFVNDEEEIDNQEFGSELATELPPQDAFDKLFNETQEASNSNFTSTPLSKQASGNTLGSSNNLVLTEEQRKRMEYNRLLAAERRKAKLTSMTSTSSNSTIVQNNDQPSSTSLILNLDSNELDEEVSNPLLKTPIQNLDSDFESLIVSTDAVKAQNNKTSEELGLDELLDLVDDKDVHMEDEEAKEPINDCNSQLNMFLKSSTIVEGASGIHTYNTESEITCNNNSEVTANSLNDTVTLTHVADPIMSFINNDSEKSINDKV